MHLVYNCTLKPYFCTTFEPASKHPTHRSIPHKPKEAENGHFVGLRKDLCFLLLGCNDETGKILRNLCVCVRRMRHDLTSGHGRKKPKPSTHVPGDSASQALCCGGGIALSMQTWRAACLQASAQLSKFGLRARPSPSGTTASSLLQAEKAFKHGHGPHTQPFVHVNTTMVILVLLLQPRKFQLHT
eukprot:360454-Chlamydomonas_euryale.AAC.2